MIASTKRGPRAWRRPIWTDCPADIQLLLYRESHFAPGQRDTNEPVIVNELRLAGYEVVYNAPPLPDLTARGHGREFYVEVKALRRGYRREQAARFESLDMPVLTCRAAEDVGRSLSAIP